MTEVRSQRSEVIMTNLGSIIVIPAKLVPAKAGSRNPRTSVREWIPNRVWNDNIEFGMTTVERMRFFPVAPGLRMT